MIAGAVGWTLDRVTDDIQPKLAQHPLESELLTVNPGYVCGIVQDASGYVKGELRIALHLEAYLGAPASYDSVLIEGSPRISSVHLSRDRVVGRFSRATVTGSPSPRAAVRFSPLGPELTMPSSKVRPANSQILWSSLSGSFTSVS